MAQKGNAKSGRVALFVSSSPWVAVCISMKSFCRLSSSALESEDHDSLQHFLQKTCIRSQMCTVSDVYTKIPSPSRSTPYHTDPLSDVIHRFLTSQPDSPDNYLECFMNVCNSLVRISETNRHMYQDCSDLRSYREIEWHLIVAACICA